MKKIVVILIALVTLQVTAQDRKREFHRQNQGDRLEAVKDLTPEEMATLRTKKMTLRLDLTEAQQKQVQAINLEEAKFKKAQMEERRKRMESGNMERPSKEERLKMMNDRLDRQIAMKQKMKNILDADQYKKWESTQVNMMERRDGKPKMMKQKMQKNRY